MLRKLGNRRGSGFTIVLAVICAVTVIGFALIDAAVQGFRDNKLQSDMDYAYYAGESAIERCFDSIQTNCTSSDYTSDITYNGTNDDFVTQYINKIRVDPKVSKVFSSAGSNAIDVDDASSKANVRIEVERAGTPVFTEGKAIIEIGLKSEVSYKKTGYKMVYAKKKFEVYMPGRYILNTAVNSIGDLMICSRKGGLKANINGDVDVYGTSPEKKNEKEQYYYGGIYARSDSQLKIDGYALTRSFIRAGEYSSSEDSSKIDVYLDAIAKCIQIFGCNDNLIVRRNAYTIDDLEMNGENSVIGINGSYFGLSQGDPEMRYHDSSSAVVSSSPIHYGYSNASLQSRIAINGNVFINGGTYKLDMDEGVGQIEDASTLWDKGNDKPYYKLYSGAWTDYNQKLIEEYKNANETQKESYSGFLNLFQVWDPIDGTGLDTEAYDQKIDDWINSIRTHRLPRGNNIPPIMLPSKISGFCNSCMAANDRLYVMDATSEADSSISRENILKDYKIPGPISGAKDISKLWEDLYKGPGNQEPWYYYCENIKTKLETLKGYLTSCCERLVSRSDTSGDGTDIIAHKFAAPRESGYGSNMFQYLVEKSWAAPDDASSSAVIKFDRNLINETLEVLPELNDKTYLVVNRDPLRTLVMTKEFKGIILTMGKVIVGRGAKIWGSIIASGRGFKDSGNFVEGSAADDENHIPRVLSDGRNLGNMDNGDYAAVLITDSYNSQDMGTPEDDDPVISFPGRAQLLDSFAYPDLKDYLYSIF